MFYKLWRSTMRRHNHRVGYVIISDRCEISTETLDDLSDMKIFSEEVGSKWNHDLQMNARISIKTLLKPQNITIFSSHLLYSTCLASVRSNRTCKCHPTRTTVRLSWRVQYRCSMNEAWKFLRLLSSLFTDATYASFIVIFKSLLW